MRATSWMGAVVASVILQGLAGCSYAYRNPAEALGPGEVGGRTVAGAELLIDGVAVSVQGAALDATSRQNGRFAMLPLPVGRHSLMFRKGKGRALQRDVEITWGKDGQPAGVWMGDVMLAATAAVSGRCDAPPGAGLADNGVAVDEVSGAVVPIDAAGGFSFAELSLGAHRVRVAVSDTGGVRYLGGPVSFDVLPSDAGTEKALSRFALHRASVAPADTARVTIRASLVGTVAGLQPTDLVVTGLNQSVPLQSDGHAQVDLPEGAWTVSLRLPAGVTGATPPPPITFVATQGEVIDLGTLYAVADSAQTLASLSCHADADCAPAPGTCVSGVCTGWIPPAQAPASVPFCGVVAAGCTPGLPVGATLPHAATCGATADPGVKVGVPCGACCTTDGVDTLCGDPGLGGCPDPAAGPGAAACSADGWCFAQPLPPSNTLRGLWASSPVDAWAVGDAGTVLHWNGSAWSNLASGTANPLLAVSGTSATGAWAVGGAGTILRWDGTSWASVASGTGALLTGVWAASPAEAWAVGSGGVILRWNGTSWSPETSGTTGQLSAVWGSSAAEVWAVGTGGLILRRTGGAWASVASGTTVDLSGVWGTAGSDVWAVGGAGTILRWTLGAWTPAASPTAANLLAVRGSSSGDVWAVGDGGTILHFNGSPWAIAPSPTANGLQAVWPFHLGEAMAVGVGGTSLNWAGTWTPVTGGKNLEYNALLAGAAGDLWALGWITDGVSVNSVTTRWNGTTWSSSFGATGTGLYDAWATSASDAWASGIGGELRHWNGTAWSPVASSVAADTDLVGVWASSVSDAWAVGGNLAGGVVARWNGTAWASGPLGTQPIYGIWGSAANDVWAVGYGGTIQHWDGAAWTPFTSGTTAFLVKVWGTGPSDVWAVGDLGTILHWDGTGRWATVASPTSSTLNGLWGVGASDVWAVAYGGTLLHWDGSAWTLKASGTTNALWSVRGRSATDLYISGSYGTILHHGP